LGLSPWRETSPGLLWGAVVALVGLALNRANVSMFAIWRPVGTVYTPHWMEVTILTGAVAAAMLVFGVAARVFPAMLGPAAGEEHAA
jgi:Ni/Fe-hydrogenase subunit HybB-like protein